MTATVSRAFDSAPLPVKQQECVPRSPRSATCANARVIAELTRSPRRAVADLRCGPGEDRRRSSPRHGKSTSWAPAPVLAGRRSPTAPPPPADGMKSGARGRQTARQSRGRPSPSHLCCCRLSFQGPRPQLRMRAFLSSCPPARTVWVGRVG